MRTQQEIEKIYKEYLEILQKMEEEYKSEKIKKIQILSVKDRLGNDRQVHINPILGGIDCAHWENQIALRRAMCAALYMVLN